MTLRLPFEVLVYIDSEPTEIAKELSVKKKLSQFLSFTNDLRYCTVLIRTVQKLLQESCLTEAHHFANATNATSADLQLHLMH